MSSLDEEIIPGEFASATLELSPVVLLSPCGSSSILSSPSNAGYTLSSSLLSTNCSASTLSCSRAG